MSFLAIPPWPIITRIAAIAVSDRRSLFSSAFPRYAIWADFVTPSDERSQLEELEETARIYTPEPDEESPLVVCLILMPGIGKGLDLVGVVLYFNFVMHRCDGYGLLM